MRKLKILELFGGIGTPRKALENLNVNLKSIDYVEVWKWAVEAYNRIFDNNYEPQDIRFWNLNVDWIFDGSPCQDFSTAGKNDMSSGRSILYLRKLEIIEKELHPRPKVVIWENVKGLVNKRNRHHFDHYLDSMKNMGYRNYWEILNSKDFGIPQSRDRVFVVSIRKDINFEFDFSKIPRTNYSPLSTFLEKEVDKSYFITQNSMKKAIQEGKIKIVDDIAQTITTKQLRWNNAGVVKIPLRNFSAYHQVINPEIGIAPTLTTAHGETPFKVAIPISEESILQNPIPDVPIFIIDGKPYHLRVLTEKECWRLMGWKDEDFQKVADMPKTHLYHMAGNAIVIPVLEGIFKQLIDNEVF